MTRDEKVMLLAHTMVTEGHFIYEGKKYYPIRMSNYSLIATDGETECLFQYDEIDEFSFFPEREIERESKYFLFGSDAVGLFNSSPDTAQFISSDGEITPKFYKAMKAQRVVFSVFEYTGDIDAFLEEYDGWGDYAEITKEEYEQLLELQL